MNHLDLFSGIGGFSLAAEVAGFTTVAFCEYDKKCQEGLLRNFPGVPIHKDIKALKGEHIEEPITLLTGGYPCQPFSVAGTKKAFEDDRDLWPEMFRIIKEVRPTWVVGENVYGHVALGLDRTLLDLETSGYSTSTFIVPACSVAAKHERQRVVIVAHVPNTNSNPVERLGEKSQSGSNRRQTGLHDRKGSIRERSRWRTQPRLGGGTHGISSWLDGSWENAIPRVTTRRDGRKHRLEQLGNAIVPQVFIPLFLAIAELEIGVPFP